MKNHLLISYSFCVLLILFLNDGARGVSLQHQLFNSLFENYSTFVRPVLNHSDALTVEFELSIYNLIDLNEKNQVMTVNAEMIMRWNDSFLRWDPGNYDGQKTIRVPWRQIWSPDVVLYNSADSAYEFAVYNTMAVVEHTGEVLLLSHAILRSSCEINIRHYPFDQQVCILVFSSWTQDSTQIRLRSGLAEGDISAFVENPEFFLENFYVELKDTIDPCCEVAFSTLKYYVQLQRRTSFTLYFFIMPGIFVNLSALFVFSLPCESGEKVSLGISALLAMMVFFMTMTENLPPSQNIPLAGAYYGTCIGVLTLNILASILVLNIHYKGVWGFPVPSALRVLLFDYTARALWIHVPPRIRRNQVSPNRSSQTENDKTVDSSDQDNNHTTGTGSKKRCDDHSLPMSVQEKALLIASTQRGLDQLANRILGLPNTDRLHLEDLEPSEQTKDAEFRWRVEELLVRIERHLAAGRHHTDLCDFGAALSEEWKLVAYVVDRLCAVLFAIITIVFNIVILNGSPEVTRYDYCRGPPGSCSN